MDFKNIKKNLPIEVYFLFIPSVLIFIISLFLLKNPAINVFGIREFIKTSFNIDITSPISMPIVSLLIILFFGFIFEQIIGFVFKKLFSKPKNNTEKNKKLIINWKYILSIFFIIVLLSFVTYSLALFTSLIFKFASPIKTAQFGRLFLGWDKTIFKTNPGIWLINHLGGTFFEAILMWTYNSIFFIFYVLLLISFFLNKKVFRRLILSFFICWIISLPIWYLCPTMSPDNMFRLDKLSLASATEIKNFNNFQSSAQLDKNLKSYEEQHIVNQNPTDRFLPISTFPSMHAALGIVIVYAGIILCPWLAIILVPWAILNGVGAVYVLEHFSVDIFSGIAVALISITIVEILFIFEGKYFKDEFGLLSGFDYVKSLIKNFSD